MQMHITQNNNKLASFGTIGLLFLAGIAGMVFLLPFQNAHAATATVTLSTITPLASLVGGPTELTGTTAGTVGSGLTITGSGFNTNAPIEVYTTVGTSTTSWTVAANQNNCAATFSNPYGGVNVPDSLTNGFAPTACVITTAAGNFKTTFVVPALPGGPQTIVVSDGTNSVSTPFTITPSVSFSKTGSNFGFPEQAIAGTLKITGFGAGETVTISTPMWVVTSYTCTTGTTLGGTSTTGAGSCTAAVGTSIADTTGGSKTVTATGGTSGLTASTSFTVNAWVAFYNSAAGSKTTYSFLGTAPTSLLVEGHGFAAGTISSGSITIGSTGTSHASITVGTSGAFYGVVVSPTANVPFGATTATIQGNTFGYANGNIALGGISTGQAISTVGVTNNFPWGGNLISSIVGTSASTGIANLDSSNYKPGTAFTASTSSPKPVQNQLGFSGFGFVPAAACGGAAGGAISISTPSGVTWSTAPVIFTGASPTAGSPDCNGAFYAASGLGETPWSSSTTPTVAASYSPVVTQAGTAPANILSPSFGVTAWTSGTGQVVDYTTTGFTVSGHGFSATEPLTVTVGAASMIYGGTCTTLATGTCGTAAGRVPDLGAGPQNIGLTGTNSGVVVTSTAGVTYDPWINANTTVSSTSLSIVSGPAGTQTILRTGTHYGAHGLYANAAYNIVWNGVTLPGVTGQIVGTFTSTATGGIPVPGVQITIPADTAGIHVLDLERTSTPGTSMMFSDNGLAHGAQGTSDYVNTDSGLGATYLTAYGDMLFLESTSLVASPTVANVGSSVAISGTGLAGNTAYDLGVSEAGLGSSSTPSTCALTGTGAASPPTTVAGTFTSTSSGAVPAGTSVAITDMPTFAGLEQGTLYCTFAQTPATFGGTTATGVAQFLLQASANLNMTTAPTGHNVILSAHALNAGAGYNIIFAPYTTSSGVTGTVVGAILANGQGAGSGTFTVPTTIQTSSGAQAVSSGQGYTVELQKVGTTSGVAIASPPTLTVGSVSSSSCNTTTCVTANGSPTQTTIGSNKATQSSFTNNSNAPITAIVYAVVHNAAGQTVAYSTATLTNVPAGSSATAYNVLFGLAPGTYSVTIFVTSTSGTAISGTSTVSVTV